MQDKTILVTGGRGPAGRSILHHVGDSVLTPGRDSLDISSIKSIDFFINSLRGSKIDTVILNASPNIVDFLSPEFSIEYMENIDTQNDWNKMMFSYMYGNFYLLKRLNKLKKLTNIYFMTTYKEIWKPMYRFVKSSTQELLMLLTTTDEFSNCNVNFVRPIHMDKSTGYGSLGIAFKNYLNDSHRQNLYRNFNYLAVRHYGNGVYNLEAVYE